MVKRVAMVVAVLPTAVVLAGGVSVAIDATEPGAVLPNTSQVLTFWNGVMKADRSPVAWPKELRRDYPIGFARYAELMACTGGNKSRDLFKNPDDRMVLDDYDFGPLVAACRGILGCGMKPYLKLGNVPPKFSSDYDGGSFSMNIRPPTDDLIHYRYMKACAAALKAAFGRDEVRSWRFAVLTEADNAGWFQVKSKSKEDSREAFFRLYDYAARAFEEELGPNLVFGTHMLYPDDPGCPGQFTVDDVVAHCMTGTNVATGKVGAPLRLLTASYYGEPDRDDLSQGRCTHLRRIRAALDKAGLKDVVTGVDEGRVIVATPGRERRDLMSRAVGASYEAAFDVRIMKEIFDDRMDYFASWGYFSGPRIHFEGVPSHHYFSARELAKFEGLKRASVRVFGKMPPKEELDAIAGVSADGQIVRAVVARFRDKLVFTNRLETAVTFQLPEDWAGKRVRVSVLTLDDRNNWFVDWERDRVAHGVTSKDSDWSWDDFAILARKGLRDEKLRTLFAQELQPRYAAKAASVRPAEATQTVSADATLALPVSFVGNGAVFLAVERMGGLSFDRGNIDWAGRASHPAVVDPVCGYPAGTVVDLAGAWKFVTSKYGADRSQFFRKQQHEPTPWKGERTICVPGCWEAQGVGEPIGAERSSRCYGGNSWQPLKHEFVGDGWYHRQVKIPSAWVGQRIWIKIGGFGSQGWVWVNDAPVAHVLDFCATRKFEITDLVKPGAEAKVVVEVTNAGATKRGSADAYGLWGGILRTVELEATPRVLIDDAWVRGDYDRRKAEVNVLIEGRRGTEGWSLRATIEGVTTEKALPSSSPSTLTVNSTLTCSLPNFRPWSPEHPNLYTALVELVAADGKVLQTRRERFGVRKIEVRGKDFYLNDRPFFVRGVGFHPIDPIKGHFIADRAAARRFIERARACGFNYARLHTRCESPEFFEVADELGLMLQPELPYYGDFAMGCAPFDPIGDARELHENFRRHPSFATYSGGNEGTFGPVCGKRFYAAVKAMDPDRLCIEQATVPTEQEWTEDVFPTMDFVQKPTTIWKRGLYNPSKPMLAHEYLNLAAKFDTRLAARFTGVWDCPPSATRVARGAWLAKFGLDHAFGDRLQDAQHHLQCVWQKRGLEAARTDPHCDGYLYWSIADSIFPNQIGWTGRFDRENPCCMAQGLFTPFFETKRGGATMADFAVFNSPVGVFVDTVPENLLVIAGETVSVDVLVANYGESAMSEPALAWQVVAADGGSVLCAGGEKLKAIPLGSVRKVATFTFVPPVVAQPTVARLVVNVGNHENAWDCWIFRPHMRRDGRDIAVSGAMAETVRASYADVLPSVRVAEAKVVIADRGSPEAKAALARGQNVIEVGGLGSSVMTCPGWWFVNDVAGAVFRTDDPLLKYLPKAPALTTLHLRLMMKGVKLPVADFRTEELAVVSEGASGCFAFLGARVDSRGGRHLFAHGLALDRPYPESLAILDGLVDRAREPVRAEAVRSAARRVEAEAQSPSAAAAADGPAATDTETGGVGRD